MYFREQSEEQATTTARFPYTRNRTEAVATVMTRADE